MAPLKIKSPSHVTKYSVWTWEINTARPLFQPLSSGNLKYRMFLSFWIFLTISDSEIICSFTWLNQKFRLILSHTRHKIRLIYRLYCIAYMVKAIWYRWLWITIVSTIAWTVISDNNRNKWIIFSNTFDKSIKTTISSVSFDNDWNFFINASRCLWCITCLNGKFSLWWPKFGPYCVNKIRAIWIPRNGVGGIRAWRDSG